MPNTLETYKAQFASLNRGKIQGELAPHKIILLLAIIDRIEECLVHGEPGKQVVLGHPIALRPHLEYFFYKEWNIHVHSEVFKPTYENPLIHMQYEPFYRLVPRIDQQTGQPADHTGARSLAALDKAFEGILLDKDLLELLVKDDTRRSIREYLIYLLHTNPHGTTCPTKYTETPAEAVFEHVLDYSFYNYGCTIDKQFHQPIFEVLGGRLERGQRKDIVLRYEGKEFAAQIENVDRQGVKSDTIRCMWKGKASSKLSTYLQQQFADDFKAISDLHEAHINKLPDNLRRFALFYNPEDGVFEMRVK